MSTQSNTIRSTVKKRRTFMPATKLASSQFEHAMPLGPAYPCRHSAQSAHTRKRHNESEERRVGHEKKCGLTGGPRFRTKGSHRSETRCIIFEEGHFNCRRGKNPASNYKRSISIEEIWCLKTMLFIRLYPLGLNLSRRFCPPRRDKKNREENQSAFSGIRRLEYLLRQEATSY